MNWRVFFGFVALLISVGLAVVGIYVLSMVGGYKMVNLDFEGQAERLGDQGLVALFGSMICLAGAVKLFSKSNRNRDDR